MRDLVILFWVGTLFAAGLVWVGLKIHHGKRHDWIAGYNRATPELRSAYDIEGLAAHLGNGLVTLGVLIFLTVGAACLEWWIVSFVGLGLFVFVAALIVIGGQRFTPEGRQRRPGDHRFLRWLLPERAFRAIERGTRQWWIECPCGERTDFWEAGGVRWKAVGEPRQLFHCERCSRPRWHRIHRKTPQELLV